MNDFDDPDYIERVKALGRNTDELLLYRISCSMQALLKESGAEVGYTDCDEFARRVVDALKDWLGPPK